jgi:acyl carrier protein
MNMTNTEKLVDAFAIALNIDASAVLDSLSYQGIPEWDSVSHMVLITELEDAFGISIDTNEVIDMNSVRRAKEILGKYNFVF